MASPKMEWNDGMLDKFWYFIAERHKIFYRRKVLRNPPPWTSDKVLRGNSFTNMYRELDPGTTWLMFNVLDNPNILAKDKAFIALAYRLFGTEEVFEELGIKGGSRAPKQMRPRSFDKSWLAAKLAKIMDEGRQAYTPAYLVSNYGRSEPKHFVVAGVLDGAARAWEDTWASLQMATDRKEAFAVLESPFGIGRFIAFQTLVDLCYPLSGSDSGILGFSNNDWVAAGPGAQKGLRLLLGEKFTMHKDMDNVAIKELVRMQVDELEAYEMPWLLDAKNKKVYLDRSNMQNCLCEFGKYVRLVEAGANRGRSRSFDARLSAANDIIARENKTASNRYAIQVEAFLE